MYISQNLPKTKKGFAHWATVIFIVASVVVVVMAGFAIATPIVVAILTPTSNTTSTNTTTSFNFNTATTYGTLYHTTSDDNDQGYVVINSIDVVNQTTGTVTSSYVEQIAFAFYTAPSTSTPIIWLYVMNRTGSTNVFIPSIIYQLPYSLITVGAAGHQTMTLSSNVLPLTQGQYVGVGFGTGGGSCYRMSNRNQYYISTSAFSTLSSASYTVSSSGGFAFTFVVRTYGYSSS